MKKSLIDTIQRLRAFAAAAYDQAIASGELPEKAAERIAPFSKMMGEAISSSVQSDLPGCAEAVRVYEELAAANRRIAQKYIEKAQDEMNHAMNIKHAIRQAVFDVDVDRIIEEDGTIVTVPDRRDPNSLSIR